MVRKLVLPLLIGLVNSPLKIIYLKFDCVVRNAPSYVLRAALGQKSTSFGHNFGLGVLIHFEGLLNVTELEEIFKLLFSIEL